MARRMIRAQRSSPYLLYLVIAFAILTVGGWVFGAWMYSKQHQTLVYVFGEQTVQNTPDLTVLWRDTLDKYRDDGNTLIKVIENKQARADAYRNEIQRLTERLAGDPFSNQYGEDLRQSVSDVLKATNDILIQTEQELQNSLEVGGKGDQANIKPTTMVAAIRSLVQRISALVLVIKEHKSTIDSLNTQIKGAADELAAAKSEHARQVAQLRSELADEKKRLEAARQSAEDLAQRLKEDTQRLQDRILAERRSWDGERNTFKQEILKLQNQLKDLGQIVAKFREVPSESGVDGRIVNIGGEGKVAYADLGKGDGVLLGMPFSIFGQSDLGKPDAQPKAHARVIKIMDNSSELRIYETQGENPVVAGDVLHNPVYDRHRRMRFVLKGKMDIDGDGIDDTEELKALIQQFGGRVDENLTVQDDFLILGEEPPVPAPPSQGAPPQVVNEYEQKRAKFIEYSTTKANAENFAIPILNLNRFLGLAGITGG